jgi:hypothetical protein
VKPKKGYDYFYSSQESSQPHLLKIQIQVKLWCVIRHKHWSFNIALPISVMALCLGKKTVLKSSHNSIALLEFGMSSVANLSGSIAVIFRLSWNSDDNK